MKTCTKCKVEKSLDEFNKSKKGKYGREARCKDCRRAYREANKEKEAARQKAYYEANKEKLAAKHKAYYEANKEKMAAWQKAYREANKEKVSTSNKAWRVANRDYQKAYKKKRYAEDPKFKTMYSLRKQTKRLGEYKKTSTIKIVGCSPESFWVMNGSPEDMSDLHIDHVVPLSWFDLSNEDHLKVCSHWSNLQYLCEEDNLSKLNRYAGSPDNVLGYKDDFDIDKYVEERLPLVR